MASTTGDAQQIKLLPVAVPMSDADILNKQAAADSNREVKNLPTWILPLILTLTVLAAFSYSVYVLYFLKPKNSAYGTEEAELVAQAIIHKDYWLSKAPPILNKLKVDCTTIKKCDASKTELVNFARSAGLLYYRLERNNDCKVQTMRSSMYTGPDPNTPGMYSYAIDTLNGIAQIANRILKDPKYEHTTEEARELAVLDAYTNDELLRKLTKTATKSANMALRATCPYTVDGEKKFLYGDYTEPKRN